MLVMNSGALKNFFLASLLLAQTLPWPQDGGRTSSADTDLQLNAEILSYSRSRGLFAGLALNGATLSPMKGPIKSCMERDDKQGNRHRHEDEEVGGGHQSDCGHEQVFVRNK